MMFSTGNRSEYDVRGQERWFVIIAAYDLAVDAFLVLSGFLVSHVLLVQLKKRDGEFTWRDLGLHYLHRYWRLTPIYLAVMLVYLPFDKGCRNYWWTNLLYINNHFMEPEQQCTGSSWYLGVDMQLHIIAPALIISQYKKPQMGIIVNLLLVVLSWACSLWPLNTIAEQVGCVNYYFWAPARMGPYIMGILLAYLLFKTRSTVPNTRATKAWMSVGWAIGTSLVAVLVGAPSVFRASDPEVTWMRSSFERLLFSSAICWVIYACCVGYGGIISEFLSWKVWLPLSRLSYVAYLMHPLVLYAFYGHYRGPIFYSGYTWFILFAGLSVWIFTGAFVFSVGVEMPFTALGKHILPRRHGRKHEDVKAT
ncbi:Hypp3334 [Branchiostoma lanceolatum]|uniref:Hypp3334 protein n=1 Tax=Branchiostoma lanceolatum TaxID=7740 RepID=A0A8K0A2E5_BRALA|nr:Hypp3334 [Branchiostoma lanceolatum]